MGYYSIEDNLIHLKQLKNSLYRYRISTTDSKIRINKNYNTLKLSNLCSMPSSMSYTIPEYNDASADISHFPYSNLVISTPGKYQSFKKQVTSVQEGKGVIVVGIYGGVSYSTDNGRSFTDVYFQTKTSAVYTYKVVFGNNFFVAIGINSKYVYCSYDGIHWEDIRQDLLKPGATVMYNWADIIFENNGFLLYSYTSGSTYAQVVMAYDSSRNTNSKLKWYHPQTSPNFSNVSGIGRVTYSSELGLCYPYGSSNSTTYGGRFYRHDFNPSSTVDETNKTCNWLGVRTLVTFETDSSKYTSVRKIVSDGTNLLIVGTNSVDSSSLSSIINYYYNSEEGTFTRIELTSPTLTYSTEVYKGAVYSEGKWYIFTSVYTLNNTSTNRGHIYYAENPLSATWIEYDLGINSNSSQINVNYSGYPTVSKFGKVVFNGYYNGDYPSIGEQFYGIYIDSRNFKTYEDDYVRSGNMVVPSPTITTIPGAYKTKINSITNKDSSVVTVSAYDIGENEILVESNVDVYSATVPSMQSTDPDVPPEPATPPTTDYPVLAPPLPIPEGDGFFQKNVLVAKQLTGKVDITSSAGTVPTVLATVSKQTVGNGISNTAVTYVASNQSVTQKFQIATVDGVGVFTKVGLGNWTLATINSVPSVPASTTWAGVSFYSDSGIIVPKDSTLPILKAQITSGSVQISPLSISINAPENVARIYFTSGKRSGTEVTNVIITCSSGNTIYQYPFRSSVDAFEVPNLENYTSSTAPPYVTMTSMGYYLVIGCTNGCAIFNSNEPSLFGANWSLDASNFNYVIRDVKEDYLFSSNKISNISTGSIGTEIIHPYTGFYKAAISNNYIYILTASGIFARISEYALDGGDVPPDPDEEPLALEDSEPEYSWQVLAENIEVPSSNFIDLIVDYSSSDENSSTFLASFGGGVVMTLQLSVQDVIQCHVDIKYSN